MNQSGWFTNAKTIHSPNFDNRPAATIIDTIIIHSISLPAGQYGNQNVEKFFQNQLDCHSHESFNSISDLTVSAHFYIKRDGQLIQFVDVYQRAWHAGISNAYGRHRVNDFSVGIELEGTDTSLFEESQYDTLNETIKHLKHLFPAIQPSHILAHSDIAPGRKTDPGPGFDWAKLV